jgi:polar amino acid transport system substrate-binding protein
MVRFALPVFLLFLLFSPALSAGQDEKVELRIGVYPAPPYIIHDQGQVSGVCIDLWNLIRDTLKFEHKIIIYLSPDSLFKDLREGKLDLSLGPYTATTDRLTHFRLSIPFYISNMGIITAANNTRPFLTVMKRLFSWTVIRWFILVLVIVTIFAFFLWLAERKGNSQQFHPGPKGVLDGIWWAFVTMSTVGYGDKIPKTSIGKILAITWMFFAISLFFVASGVISSELTISKLQSNIQNAEDLRAARVGAIYNSGYAETLLRHGIKPILFHSPEAAIEAIENESIDAFVYDLSFLNYILERDQKTKKLVLIPSTLNLQYLSFITNKKNAELMDKINPALLGAIDGNSWEELLLRYGLTK